jgi:2-polyprenyl-3-methyl-5-hydroxy-6-metoxy-1,4-benzoquinol methylase
MNKTPQNIHTDIYLESFNSASTIAGSVILDIGCGDGYASKQFINNGANSVYSLDPFTKLLENNRPIWLSDTTSFFSKDWKDIDTLNLQFDIVWHHHVIEHIEDCFTFLRKTYSLLTDSGQMWMACPNMSQHSIFSPGHIHNFQAAQLVEVLKRCGYAVGDISIWVLKGQIRVRVPKLGNTNYPEPMRISLEKTGRCPSELLNNWNWKR